MNNDYVYETKEVNGYTCKVLIDTDPVSPNDWDNLGTIYSNHRHYDPCDHKIDEILIEDEDGNDVIDPDYIYVPIYYYEHSGITISAGRGLQYSDPWDSGCFGVMAVHKDKAIKEFGDVSNPEIYEKVVKCLKSEIEEWDMYLTGSVYGYEVYDEDDCFVDSCWGFYGEPEEVMKEAVSIAESDYNEKKRIEAEEEARIQLYEMICEPFWID